MVRSYSRHAPSLAFGIIASSSTSAPSSFDGKLAFVPAEEDLLVWDVKSGKQVSMWHSPSHTSPISFQARSPDSSTYAISYLDGSIKIWSFPPNAPSSSSSIEMREAEELLTFNGHKKTVTHMAWDSEGERLVSGGTEGEIVVWDVGEERGIVRLHSHRSPITSLHFIPHPTLPSSQHPGYLISTSMDTLLKLWDLQSNHCIQTLVVGRAPVTSCAVRSIDGGVGEEDTAGAVGGGWEIVTGSQEGETKGFFLSNQALQDGLVSIPTSTENPDEVELSKFVTSLAGTLPLPNSSSAIPRMAFHPTLPLLFLQTSDKTISVLKVLSEEELEKRRVRRAKRSKSKKNKDKEIVATAPPAPESWADGFKSYTTIHPSSSSGGRIKSFAFSLAAIKSNLPVLLHLTTNALEVHSISVPGGDAAGEKGKMDADADEDAKAGGKLLCALETPGHRGAVTCIDVSSSDDVVATGSNGELKLWNLKTQSCIRTLECGFATCLAFLPGDRHIIVGTKEGELQLFDVPSSTLLSTTAAHTAAISSLHLSPTSRSLVTGSSDKDIKFWDFTLTQTSEGATVIKTRLGEERVIKKEVLGLVHTKTLRMTDEVLGVKYTPDGRLLAVALLDSTVKVFFADSLKFFLSLYGHKLPVLSMDISSDSKMIITSSADKNVKIWGLDFGDCHKSLFAHDDAIPQCVFEKEGHYFWTCGKDGSVRYWDGDKFDMIQKLDGHHGPVNALAVSKQGNFVVSGSSDRSIRVWEKTDEPLFLEEERERELEQLYDAGVTDSLNRANTSKPATEGQEEEVSDVTKQTVETLMSGEKIMEALDIATESRVAWAEYRAQCATMTEEQARNVPTPDENPILKAMGSIEPDKHVLNVIAKIPTAFLQDALVVMPFRYVGEMMECLSVWASKEWNTNLLSRILIFLLRTHHHQIVSTRHMRLTLMSLKKYLRAALQRQKDTIGYNLAALKFVQRQHEVESNSEFFEDEDTVRKKIEESAKKRKRVVV